MRRNYRNRCATLLTFLMSTSLSAVISDDIIDIYSQQGLAVFDKRSMQTDVIMQGRSYYEKLKREGLRNHWFFPVTVSYFFSSKAINNAGQSADLSNIFTGRPIRFSDVSLFCNLCEENKVRSVNRPALGFDRGGFPININAPFGAYRDDIYPTLVAPVEVNFNADRQQIECDITALYRYWPPDDRYQCTFGLLVPFKSIRHALNTKFTGGSLYREAFNAITTAREDTLKAFLREYLSVDDFFIRGILGQKNIRFKESNRKSGIGDIVLFGTADCAGIFRCVQSLQAGMAFIIPSGVKANQNILFDPSLSSNCFKIDLFVNMLFNSPIEAFNPFVRGAVELSLIPYSPFGGLRAPRLVVQDKVRVMVNTVYDLDPLDIAFANFQNYWVDTFSQYDSAIAPFADTTASISQRQGAQFIAGIGNYAYNVAGTGARLALMYSYLYKLADSFSGSTFNRDVHALTRYTKVQAHTFTWSIAWPRKIFDIFVGSEHVFTGQNVIRDNRVFVSCAARF